MPSIWFFLSISLSFNFFLNFHIYSDYTLIKDLPYNKLFFEGMTSIRFGDFYNLYFHITSENTLLKVNGNMLTSPLVYLIINLFPVDIQYTSIKCTEVQTQYLSCISDLPIYIWDYADCLGIFNYGLCMKEARDNIMLNNIDKVYIFFGLFSTLILFSKFIILRRISTFIVTILLIITFFTSYPFLFTFDRGNTIIASYTFFCLFEVVRNRNKYLEFLFGALSISLKYYALPLFTKFIINMRNGKKILFFSALGFIIFSSVYYFKDSALLSLQYFLDFLLNLKNYGFYSKNELANFNVSFSSIFTSISYLVKYYDWSLVFQENNNFIAINKFINFITQVITKKTNNIFSLVFIAYVIRFISKNLDLKHNELIIAAMIGLLIASPHSPYYWSLFLFLPACIYMIQNPDKKLIAILFALFFSSKHFLLSVEINPVHNLRYINFDSAINAVILISIFYLIFKSRIFNYRLN